MQYLNKSKRGALSIYALRLFIAACMFMCSNASFAQLEVSSGIDMVYPLLLNSSNARINYNQLGFGVRVGVAYKPADVQFFPMLNISYGITKLPLKQINQNVVVLNTNYLNVMINENYVAHFQNAELYIYGGVGFSYLKKNRIGISGKGNESMKGFVDSVVNPSSVAPAINLGFEYNYGQSAGKPLYITMGINFQYILLLRETNMYYFNVQSRTGPTYYNASLSGSIISPGFYLALHYLINLHKKSGFYLD